jgi:CspA family cold shock protein
MILNITFAHYKLLLQCITGTVKFSMNQRLRIHYRRRNRKRHFVHASGINAEELREGDRVSYEEEGRKGKVAAKVVIYLKKFIFAYECLRRSDLFGTFFFTLISKLLKKQRFVIIFIMTSNYKAIGFSL